MRTVPGRVASRVALVLSTIASIVAFACAGQDPGSSTSSGASARTAARSTRTADAPPAPAAVAPGTATPAALTSEAAPAGDPAAAPTFNAQTAAAQAPDSDRSAGTSAAMLIRTGTASIQVDSVELAAARLRALAASLGGYVANASFAGGVGQVRSATLEIKVPAARFDALQGGLAPLGRVDSVSVQAEDVGEEFVDVGAQLANGRRLEARLVALADRQSNRLADLLLVEHELARVRGEIDRAEGRLRYLRAHSAVSTLAVTVHARPPLLGDSPAAHPITDAFRDAWRLFVGFVGFAIASLGAVVPLGALALLIALARRWWVGRRVPRLTPRPLPAAQGPVRSSGSSGDQGPTSRPPNDPRAV